MMANWRTFIRISKRVVNVLMSLIVNVPSRHDQEADAEHDYGTDSRI